MFSRILKISKSQEVEEVESIPSNDYYKICGKGHEQLRKYYKSGNIEEIVEKDDIIQYEDKVKGYFI